MSLRHRIILIFMFMTFFLLPSGSGRQTCHAQNRRSQKKVSPAKKAPDYSQFSHRTHAIEQELACESCHQFPSKSWKTVRKGDGAFPDVTEFPEHPACLNCHRVQFFARERPAPRICANCHVAVTPRDTTRWLFPSLGDVSEPARRRREFVPEFGVSFPHDKHIDVVGFNGNQNEKRFFVAVSFQEKKNDSAPNSCPVCHETYQPQGNSSDEYVTKPPQNLGDKFWLKKGTFKTAPNSHTVCFTCHNADSGIAPDSKDCNVCHKLLEKRPDTKTDFDLKVATGMGISDRVMLTSWSKRVSAGGFRHEGGAHPDLSCLTCHHVETLNTLDRKTMKVPISSCGGADGCHITATSDDGGILNFEIDEKKKNPSFVCTKCHVNFGLESAPASHSSALPARK
jgi:hypothetical protein